MSELKLRCHALKKDGERCSKNAREGCLSCGTHKEQEEALRQANVDTTDGWTEPLLPAFDAVAEAPEETELVTEMATKSSATNSSATKSSATKSAVTKSAVTKARKSKKSALFTVDVTAKTESSAGARSDATTDDNVLQKLRGDFFRKVWDKNDGADFKALEWGLNEITRLQDNPKTAFVMKEDFAGFGWKKREQWLDTHIVPALYPEA